MNIILNNAKAIFTKNLRPSHVFLPSYQIQILFDKSYISLDGTMDCRYFLNLLQNSLQSIHKKSSLETLLLVLPPEWVMQHSFLNNNLSHHQLEREVMIYFQYNMQMNINEYEFIVDKILQKSIAVKKKLVQNIYSCFDEFKWHGALKIVIDSAYSPIGSLRDDRKDNDLWIKFCL